MKNSDDTEVDSIEVRGDDRQPLSVSADGDRKTVKINLELDTTTKDIGENPYKKWIHLAHTIDSWRPFPRLFIGLYMYMVFRVIEWYLSLPDPSMEQSGLISVVVGAGAAWFGLYVNSGRSNKK